MKAKKAAILQMGTALIFAISILISSKLLGGHEHKDSINILFIGLWFMTSTVIISLTERKYKSNECKSYK